jgi:hypothetical protein
MSSRLPPAAPAFAESKGTVLSAADRTNLPFCAHADTGESNRSCPKCGHQIPADPEKKDRHTKTQQAFKN